jgi:hypothetical protein
MRRHLALSLGFGLAYLVLGTILFLRAVDAITLRWSYLGPVALMLAGAALAAGGVLAERLRHAAPGDLPAPTTWPGGGPDTFAGGPPV